MRLLNSLLVLAAVFTLTLASGTAHADWPSPKEVIKKIGPLAGMNGDQVEFAIFAMDEPSCASTIVSYTVAQDYSLVGFIGGLKATKMQSIPGMPHMSESQCKAYNPVQQAYVFVDSMGDKLLGKEKADFMRKMLQEQIAEGKSSLDAQIAAIPYIGTILTNWDCECSAAFKTNLQSEKTIDATVGAVISIGKSVKDGDIPGALEKMVTKLGPPLACKLGAEWTGVGSIPVVSDIAAEACESVAGKAVEWVVSGASTTAEALGIIGGEHIPPEEYYKNMFTPEIAKDGYVELANTLYGKCYKYFEASNMAASTAKKVCVGMRTRYIEESLGKIQWNGFQAERQDYYNKNVKPKAASAANLSDADFAKIKTEVETTCKSYFSQKYPKATSYAKAYGGEPIEDICTSFVTYSKSSYHPWDMDKERAKAQLDLVHEISAKHTPFCKKGDARNAVVCSGQAIKSCTADLTDLCKKSSLPLGGMERPCCQLGTGTDSVYEHSAKWAEELAAKQKPYCKTQDVNPLRITCSLEKAYETCLKMPGTSGLPDCEKAEKYGNGAAKQVCCAYDAGWLASVPGVTEAKDYAAKSGGNCNIGGMQEGLGHDPRIVNCANGKPLEACQTKFKGKCAKIGVSGYVEKTCCDMAVFAAAKEDEKPYDPAARSADELALTEKAVAESHGQCHYGMTADGKEDKFKVVCDTLKSAEACLSDIGRPAQTACSKKMKDGWVTSPCCERSPKALALDVNDKPAPTEPVNNAAGKPLGGNIKMQENRKTGLGTVRGGDAQKRATGLHAPEDKKTLSPAPRIAPATTGRNASPSAGGAGSTGRSSPASTPARAAPEETEPYKP